MLWAQAAAGLLCLVCGAAWMAAALRHSGGNDRAVGVLGRWLANRRHGVPIGALAGAAATVAVQSSSLAVIAVVSAADAGALALPAAWAAAVGANVGSALIPQALAWEPPLWVLAGVAAVAAALWAHRGSRRAGRVLAGAVAIDAGLALIGRAASGLLGPVMLPHSRHASLLAAYGAGTVTTALLFSSTLTIGSVQRLAQAGLVPLPAAIAFALGANVGTTADVLVASAGCQGRGRATALFHFAFNLVATAAALPAVRTAADRLRAWAVPPAAAVAHAHAGMNLAAAIIVLPGLAAWAARRRPHP